MFTFTTILIEQNSNFRTRSVIGNPLYIFSPDTPSGRSSLAEGSFDLQVLLANLIKTIGHFHSIFVCQPLGVPKKRIFLKLLYSFSTTSMPIWYYASNLYFVFSKPFTEHFLFEHGWNNTCSF